MADGGAGAFRQLHRRTLFALIAGMALIAALVMLVCIGLLYRASYSEELHQLEGSARSLASMLEAVARFDARFSAQDNPGGSYGATMSQVEEGLLNQQFQRPTEELVVGLRSAEGIRALLLQPGSAALEEFAVVAADGSVARPLYLALNGESGGGEFINYRGARVLSGYAPVPTLGIGIAHNIDLAEVRAPFHRAAWVCALLAALAVAAGAFSFRLLLRPLTERGVQAAKAMESSESRFALAARGTDQGIWDWDLRSGQAWLSPRGQELLGYEAGEVEATREGWELRVHPEDRARALEEVRRHLAERGQYRTEYRLRMKDGGYRWFRAAGQAQWDGQGRPLRMAGSIEDITESNAAQRRLAESEALLRLVLEVLPVGVWITDQDGVITLANEAGKRIWAGARYVGIEQYGEYKGWWHESGQPIAAEEWALARAVRRGETSLNEVIDIECFDGTRKTILNSAVPLLDPDGAIRGAIVLNQDITDSIHQQREVEAGRNYLKAIFDNEPECIKLLDTEGRLLDMNPAGLTMIEAESLDAVRNQPIESLVCEEDRPGFRDAHAAILRGEKRRLRFGITSLRGTPRQMESHAVPLWDEEGKAVKAVLSVTRDVTEMEAAEQAERESLARLNEAQRVARMGSWEVDLLSRSLTLSDEACRILEFAPDDAGQGWEWLERVHPEDLERLQQAIAVSQGNAEPFNLTHRLRMADGRLKYVRHRGETVFDANGRPLRTAATLQDITEPYQTQRALESAQAQISSIVDHAPVILFTLDPAGMVTLAQGKGLEVIGATSETLLGRCVYDIFPGREDLRADLGRAFAGADVSYTFQTADWAFETHCSPVRDDHGTVTGVLGAAYDVTEQVRARERTAAQLAEKELLLKELHHRVKNNLHVISSLISLQAASCTDPALQPLLRDAQNRIEAMALIHETLYERAGVFSIDFEDYAGKLCRYLFQSFGADTKRIALALHGPAGRLSVSAAVTCGLIINEALSNSLKYAFPEGREGNIAVELVEEESGGLRLHIADDGIGLPPSGAKVRDGALGLRLIERLAEQLGGAVEREAGPGTGFSIRFPAGGVE